ncbi:MAG: Hsp20/alpha crystallin family protein [Bacteroidales bacterium]|nr:Hsp20/alpha crystallin family protein [Bacteroidales bacterium]
MNLVRINRYPVFNDLMENFERNFIGRLNEANGDVPAVNIKDQKDKYVIEFAAPGLNKEDFKVDLDNYVLTVSSEKKIENEEKESNYTRREFVYSSFSRSFTLPRTVNADKIKADYVNGILAISLPKKEEETKLTRQIEIS